MYCIHMHAHADYPSHLWLAFHLKSGVEGLNFYEVLLILLFKVGTVS